MEQEKLNIQVAMEILILYMSKVKEKDIQQMLFILKQQKQRVRFHIQHRNL